MTTLPLSRGARSVAGVLGAILAALLILVGVHSATPAHADSGDYAIEIHKFEQPDELGARANGLPQDTSGLIPVAGATFTAKRVPGIDLSTAEGQAAAGQLTDEAAAALVADQPVAGEATSDANGDAPIRGLERGLFYVQETAVPAGFVGAAPFIVALPMAGPEGAGQLETVHVYPKNARVGIVLEVVDEDAISLGDTVGWHSRSSISNHASLDGYRIDYLIPEHIEPIAPVTGLADGVDVMLDCSGCAVLTAGTDYTVVYDPGARTLTVDFRPAGLAKLVAAATVHPTARVTVDYQTVVLSDGVHVTEAVLDVSGATGLGPLDMTSADHAETLPAVDHPRQVRSTAMTKWGPLSVLVHEQGEPANVVAGAGFKLYVSETDAREDRNAIAVNGVDEWFTDANGRLLVDGLRFSNFVNGLDREASDPLFRHYWAVPTHLPEGWAWVDARPLAGVVSDAVEFETLEFLVVRTSPGPAPTPPTPTPPAPTPAPGPIPGLPVTGAQLGGIALLAGVLAAAGVALAARRRRERAETEELLER